MMTKRTELVFILDRSGSMANLTDDTIGGYNGLLKQQQAEPGETRVSTVLFDDRYELLHDRVDLHQVQPLTPKEYYVRGTTALLDAVGKAVSHTIQAQLHDSPEKRAEKVMFVIITDGYENASREYGLREVKSLIEQQKAFYGWEFLFLGANIDAIGAAAEIGIDAERAVNFHADSVGSGLCYQAVSQTISSVRSAAPIAADWKKRIERDFLRRRP